MQNYRPEVINTARKVGLLQAATVISTNRANSRQTYVFSPLLDIEDNKLHTSEVLHERKLFIAHILFGHEKAESGGGRIQDPVVLVNALLRRGTIGPASNIGTDYHLLEASGIIRVEQTDAGPLMHMVKEEIVSDSLAFLQRTLGPDDSSTISSRPLETLRPPGIFIPPEKDRQQVGEDAATMEVMNAAIQKFREEAQRAARHENPFE